MKSIQELLRELCNCIVKEDDGSSSLLIDGNGGGSTPDPPAPEKPDLDTFDPNIPFCIENVGDVPVVLCVINYYTSNNYYKARDYCEISYDNASWQTYRIHNTSNGKPDAHKADMIALANRGDRVYFRMGDFKKNTSTYGSSTTFCFLNEHQNIIVRARGNIASLNYGKDDSYKTKYLEIDSEHEGCFFRLFKDCTKLVQAPDLPATTLAKECYTWMFNGCYRLNSIRCLATDISATDCTLGWLADVASKGDFYTTKGTKWYTNSASGIPEGWTRHDV